MMFARWSSRCKKRSIRNLICSMNDSRSPFLGLISNRIGSHSVKPIPWRWMRSIVRRWQIIPAFLTGFDTAEPVTNQQNHDASEGRKPEIQRAQREKGPLAPNANQMACDE